MKVYSIVSALYIFLSAIVSICKSLSSFFICTPIEPWEYGYTSRQIHWSGVWLSRLCRCPFQIQSACSAFLTVLRIVFWPDHRILFSHLIQVIILSSSRLCQLRMSQVASSDHVGLLMSLIDDWIDLLLTALTSCSELTGTICMNHSSSSHVSDRCQRHE